MAEKRLAGILIRSAVTSDRQIADTLHLMGLRNKNVCVIVDNNPSMKGMLERCKDYVTYGEISDECYLELKKKLGETYIAKDGKKKEKKYFRMHPPRGGFERKGIKKPYHLGGALGNRGNKMDGLIKKML